MKSLTRKHGDLLSHFDIIIEGNTAVDFNSTSFKQMLIDNHFVEANEGKIKGQLPVKHILGFCKTFKKFTKNLGSHLILKTNDLQNIIFTTTATDINVTSYRFYLFVPLLIPNTETQVMFNESFKNNCTITYDSWYTERKLSTDINELHFDIGSAQHVKSSKYLIASFQTADRIASPNKNNNIAIFDNVNVKKFFCEIDGYRYLKDVVLSNFPENDYLDQYRYLKLYYKQNVGEEIMNFFISYTDMKNKYPIQVIDLRHGVDHISHKKIQVFEEFNTGPANVKARIFVILIRHRHIEMISDGNKVMEIKLI